MKKLISTLSLLSLSTFAFSKVIDKPNIILFLVDDMGLMDTSVPFDVDKNGNQIKNPLNDWYKTPNMERLANQGIRFSTFYAQSVSSPSRTSIMTGQNATRHHTTNWINSESNNRNTFGPYKWNWRGLKSSDFTLPRMLKGQGYRTIHVGKAHFGCMNSEGEFPENIGFDVNIAGSSIGHPGSYYGEWGYGNIKGDKSRAVPGLEKYHGTDTFLSEALTIEAKAQIDKCIDNNEPFFLYMAHYAVHAPFQADKRFINNYKDNNKSEQAKAFATLIEGMDKSLGDLMDHLQEKGIADNTLIIFLGDNGGDAPLGSSRGYSSSAPFRGKKGSEFEGGMRVPCIIGWAKPSKKNILQNKYPIKCGKIQTQLGTVMDIYPTLATISGAKIPSTHIVDGQDLSILMKGEKDSSRKDSFIMHFPHQHRGSYFTMYREGDWKVVYYYNPEHPEQPGCILYNLKEDPYEHEEISKKYPQKTQYMLTKMKENLEKEGALYPVDFDGKEIKPNIEYFFQ